MRAFPANHPNKPEGQEIKNQKDQQQSVSGFLIKEENSKKKEYIQCG